MYLRQMRCSRNRRWWRHLIPVTSALCIFILLILTLFMIYNLDPVRSLTSSSRTKTCFDDLNQQRSRLLNTSARVRIIPSSHPGKLSGHEDTKEEERRISQQNNPCISIPAPPYKSKDSVLICIHNPEKDKVISAHLQRNSEWERDNVQALHQAHIRHPNMMLVDLGCNLGAFTLPAAYLGLQVLAVDAMMPSLRLLQKSLFINGLSCHVTLVHNALYRRRMPMRVAFDPQNVGGSKVVEIMASRKNKVPSQDIVDAICLDDLVPLARGREVFLKMDIEETEDAVLECSHQFFKEVDVKIVLMEWIFFRNQEEKARTIMDFLTSQGMKPAWSLDSERDIDIHAAHSWPDNVFWIKNA